MRQPRADLLALPAAALAMAATGCGDQIDVPEGPDREAATIFLQRCSGCHTFDAAASQGSRPPRKVTGGERTNGPNFNVRKESVEDVLFAIRNGGFSGAIMPANIVVGEDAQKVAEFVAEYAGTKPEKGPGRDAISPKQNE